MTPDVSVRSLIDLLLLLAILLVQAPAPVAAQSGGEPVPALTLEERLEHHSLRLVARPARRIVGTHTVCETDVGGLARAPNGVIKGKECCR